MSDKRTDLYLFDSDDITKIFHVSHENGAVTLGVPNNSNMTVSGKTTYLGTSTYLKRHDSVPAVSLVDANVGNSVPADHSPITHAMAVARQVELAAQVTAHQGAWGIAAIEHPYIVKGSAYGGVIEESSAGQSAHGNWVDNVAVVMVSLPEIVERSFETLFDDLDSDMSTLTTNLSNEVTRATTQEGVLDTRVTSEVATLVAADTANAQTAAQATAAETSRAQQAEGVLQVNINTEQARAEAVEQGIAATVAAETTAHANEMAAANASLTAESSRAAQAENGLQADVDQNEADFDSGLLAAQNTLQSNIDTASGDLTSEVTRATNTEAGLQTQVTALLSNSDGVALNSLQEVVDYFNSGDNSHDYLLGLLISTVLSQHNVLNTLLEPDFGALTAPLQTFYDQNVNLTSLSATGADGTSMDSTLSMNDLKSFLSGNNFVISYDLTRRITIDPATGAKTLRDWDWVTEDLFIASSVAQGLTSAQAQGAWAAALAANGNDVQVTFTNTVGMSSTIAMKMAIQAVYGFTPGDLTKVPLTYADPQNYMLEVYMQGAKPFFGGAEVSYEDEIGWALSYCSTPGDVSTKLSTILSGTQSGNTLTISTSDLGGAAQAVEYPVSGNSWSNLREGTFISDISALVTA